MRKKNKERKKGEIICPYTETTPFGLKPLKITSKSSRYLEFSINKENVSLCGTDERVKI